MNKLWTFSFSCIRLLSCDFYFVIFLKVYPICTTRSTKLVTSSYLRAKKLNWIWPILYSLSKFIFDSSDWHFSQLTSCLLNSNYIYLNISNCGACLSDQTSTITQPIFELVTKHQPIFEFHDVIKCLSIKQVIHFTE